MTKDEEREMLQCLDALEEVNEGLTGTLRECVNIIDRFLPLGDHEIIWLDAYHDIQRLIERSEKNPSKEARTAELISPNPIDIQNELIHLSPGCLRLRFHPSQRPVDHRVRPNT